MAYILNEAGFTQTENKLYAAFARAPLTGLEHRIIDVVLRQTAGYHRFSAPLPLSFICSAVNAKKQNVSLALKELIRKKVLIETAPATNRYARELAVNANTDEWNFSRIRKEKEPAESPSSLPAEEIPVKTSLSLPGGKKPAESSPGLPYKEEEKAVGSSSALLYAEEEKAVVSSPGLPKEAKHAESSGGLPKAHVREPQRSSGRLPQGHQADDPLNIYKYKNIKEVVAVVVNNTFSGSRLQKLKTAAALRKTIISIVKLPLSIFYNNFQYREPLFCKYNNRQISKALTMMHGLK